MRRIQWALGLMNLMRSVSPGAIAAEATQPHRIVVLSTGEQVARWVAQALAGDGAAEAEGKGDLLLVVPPAAPPLPEGIEVVVWAVDRPQSQTGGREDLAKLLRQAVAGARLLVVVFRSRDGLLDWEPLIDALPPSVRVELLPVVAFDPGDLRADLVPLVLRMVPELKLALARHFPPFRQQVSQQVIREASAANARFAAVSNLPALIPVIGNLLAASADLYVITRNQIQMVFVLAAIFGRDLGSGLRLLLEVAPLVGTGFFWRTVAREIAALMPVYLGAVPKILIAYTGTFVLGESVAFYFTRGRRPERKTLDTYYRAAVEQAKGFASRLPPGRHPENPKP